MLLTWKPTNLPENLFYLLESYKQNAMSSLRNAVKRITHKERSQPQDRSHLGILEKKKDYKVRAKDYHRKEDAITAMRERASMRNPDEFYFGMQNSKIQDGKHRKTDEYARRKFEEDVGSETVRLMKDQDLRYIRLQKQKDAKKIQKLRSSLHQLDDDGKTARRHTVFVSPDEAEGFDAARYFDTVPELVGRAHNRPRLKDLQKAIVLEQNGGNEEDEDETFQPPTAEELAQKSKVARRLARKLAKAKSVAYREVEAREKRVAAMKRAEAHLETERLLAGKGRKRKIKAAENGEPAVFKWRRKRLK